MFTIFDGILDDGITTTGMCFYSISGNCVEPDVIKILSYVDIYLKSEILSNKQIYNFGNDGGFYITL